MITFNEIEVLSEEDLKPCLRVTSRFDGKAATATVEFVRWEWLKLCARCAWRMLRGVRFHPRAWSIAASMLWLGLTPRTAST